MTYLAVLYEVTLQVQPALAPAVEQYMRTHHISAILRTGCFTTFDSIRLGKENFAPAIGPIPPPTSNATSTTMLRHFERSFRRNSRLELP